MHYHPVSGDQEQLVGIHNRAASRYALVGGARISGEIDPVLSNAWLLPPDRRAILVRNRPGFAVRYGGERPCGGEFVEAPFSGVADADADSDGWKVVEEYIWGSSDADAAAVP